MLLIEYYMLALTALVCRGVEVARLFMNDFLFLGEKKAAFYRDVEIPLN